MRDVFEKPVHQWVLFLFAVWTIIVVSDALVIETEVSRHSVGYRVHWNIDRANEAARLGYVNYENNDYAEHFDLPWNKKPGVMKKVASGPDDFDDVGYPILLQLLALSGVEITLHGIEITHNLMFILSAIIFSALVVTLTNRFSLGVVVFAAGMLLKYKLANLVYGWPENRTLVILAPSLVFFLMYGFSKLKSETSFARSASLMMITGIAIGALASIRSSEGMAAGLTVIAAMILCRIRLRKKIQSGLFLIVGFFLIPFVLPSAVSLHKDVKTGVYESITPYLQGPGSHPIWQSVMLGVGKYPNSLAMRYDDIRLYNVLREKNPNAMHPTLNVHGPDFYPTLRRLYFSYVSQYPIEYLINVAKTIGEVFYFIPYITDAGRLPTYYGFLPIKDGVDVELRDRATAPNSLLNLRYKYLSISMVEWIVYMIAILGYLLMGVLSQGRPLFSDRMKAGKNIRQRLTFCRWKLPKEFVFLLTTMGIYLALLLGIKVAVPAHGFSFVVGFWLGSALCWVLAISLLLPHHRLLRLLPSEKAN